MAYMIRRLRWLAPGAGFKRWMTIALIGLFVLYDAFARYANAQGWNLNLNELIDDIAVDYIKPSLVTTILFSVGGLLLLIGVILSVRALVAFARTSPHDDARLRDGYTIVAIGGGTGLSTLLRGLKSHTTNLTAVVTVSDDGGSSGRLQKEFGVLPPGDIRNCLVALADDEAMVTDLFRYRFSEGEGLSGHSFGNLFLVAMTGITGNFEVAIRESSRVLNIVGRVLPSTLGIARLCARFKDGTVVKGESTITATHKPIESVYFEPAVIEPLEEVIAAIRAADAIVLGPGSLYTSIIPNLLVARVAREIATARAVKMYICNVMTQPGETDSLSASQHVEALSANVSERVFDYVITNARAPERLREKYEAEGQIPVEPDVERIRMLGFTPIIADVISENQTVRHDSEKLANVVIDVIDHAIAARATLVRPAEAYDPV